MFGGSVSIGTRVAHRPANEAAMQRTVALTVAVLGILWASCGPAAAQDSRPKQPPAAKQAALTGCVDEQDGHYVLIHDQTMDLIATLEAEGFPTEGFAKHLGHKVTVRGTVTSEEPRPVMKVRSIETVSEACGKH